MVKFGEQLQLHGFAFGDVLPVSCNLDYESLKQLIYNADTTDFLEAFLRELAKVFSACLSVCLDVDQQPQCARCAARTVRIPQRKMRALNEYVRINREGCRKILKKFDKNTGSHVLSEYMTIVDALLESAQHEVDRYLLRNNSSHSRKRSSSCPPASRNNEFEPMSAPAPPRRGPVAEDCGACHSGPTPAVDLHHSEATPASDVHHSEATPASDLHHSGPTPAADVPSALYESALPAPPSVGQYSQPFPNISLAAYPQPAGLMSTVEQRTSDFLNRADADGSAYARGSKWPPPTGAFGPAVADSPLLLSSTSRGGETATSPIRRREGAQYPSPTEMIVWDVVSNGPFEGRSVGVVARSACARRMPGTGRGTVVSVSATGEHSVRCEQALVFDPENKARYLVGTEMIEMSTGYEDFVKKSKNFLCMLHQKGHCRAGSSCNQLHVDKTAVATLRLVAGKGRTFSAQSRQNFVSELRNIRDPVTNECIVIPFCKTEESAGREEYARRQGEGEWTLCIKHLDGTCKEGSACSNIHVEPSHVLRVRAGDACCPNHAPGRQEPLPEGYLLRIRLSGRQSDSQIIPSSAVSLTKGLQRLPQQTDGYRHFPIGKVCRLHQENRCDYGRNCNNVHLCRQLYTRIRGAKSDGGTSTNRTAGGAASRTDQRGGQGIDAGQQQPPPPGIQPMFYPHPLLQQGMIPVLPHAGGMQGVNMASVWNTGPL